MSQPLPTSEIILYQTEDGRTRIQCRFENGTLWLTQALIGELFEKDVRTINEHLVNIFDEGELRREPTIRKFRIVRTEGKREVAREIEHYNLDAILAVGFRVRSHRGTQFRQWAIGRLNEYLVKGFTMDDERLKNPPGLGQKDYFDEQLERIRDIRSSEPVLAGGHQHRSKCGRSPSRTESCRLQIQDGHRSKGSQRVRLLAQVGPRRRHPCQRTFRVPSPAGREHSKNPHFYRQNHLRKSLTAEENDKF